MIIDRIWAMPNKETFSIPPVNALVKQVSKGHGADPFSNGKRYATLTNDLDNTLDADYHLDALEFLTTVKSASLDYILFDPPYSPRQVSECYRKMKRSVNMQTTQSSFWSRIKKEINRTVKTNGIALTCCWNSGGVGKKYGFEIEHIRLVPHGGWHNDTIVVIERKNTLRL